MIFLKYLLFLPIIAQINLGFVQVVDGTGLIRAQMHTESSVSIVVTLNKQVKELRLQNEFVDFVVLKAENKGKVYTFKKVTPAGRWKLIILNEQATVLKVKVIVENDK
jgi:hypothetical protein